VHKFYVLEAVEDFSNFVDQLAENSFIDVQNLIESMVLYAEYFVTLASGFAIDGVQALSESLATKLVNEPYVLFCFDLVKQPDDVLDSWEVLYNFRVNKVLTSIVFGEQVGLEVKLNIN